MPCGSVPLEISHLRYCCRACNHGLLVHVPDSTQACDAKEDLRGALAASAEQLALSQLAREQECQVCEQLRSRVNALQATVDLHRQRAEHAAASLGSMQRRADAAESLAGGTQVRAKGKAKEGRLEPRGGFSPLAIATALATV